MAWTETGGAKCAIVRQRYASDLRGRTLFSGNGAGAQNRTVDLLITNQLLYP